MAATPCSAEPSKKVASRCFKTHRQAFSLDGRQINVTSTTHQLLDVAQFLQHALHRTYRRVARPVGQPFSIPFSTVGRRGPPRWALNFNFAFPGKYWLEGWPRRHRRSTADRRRSPRAYHVLGSFNPDWARPSHHNTVSDQSSLTEARVIDRIFDERMVHLTPTEVSGRRM